MTIARIYIGSVLVVTLGVFLLAGPTPRRAAAAEGDKKPKATFEVYKDKAGEFRWRLRAQNTKVLATASEGYSDKRSCLSAIESVKRDVVDAPVVEQQAADSDASKADEPKPAPKAAPRE
jgi:uncharacterized protein YegP (UPF0339 family)